MKQFIREHPWRLEIIPLLIVAFAAIYPLMERQNELGSAWLLRTSQLRGLTPSARWLLDYTRDLVWILHMWLIVLCLNHVWTLTESKKRFNWLATIMAANMASMAINQAYILGFGEPNLVRSAVMWIVPVLAYVLIEHTRPFVARKGTEQMETIVPDVTPGEPFYYREVASERWLLLLLVLFWVWLAETLWSLTGSPRWSVCLFPFIFVMWALSRSVFVVSSERLMARFLFWGMSVPMDQVRACRIADYDRSVPWSYKGTRFCVAVWHIGPCLSVETVQGKKYLLGMNRPEFACRLISGALAARTRADASPS